MNDRDPFPVARITEFEIQDGFYVNTPNSCKRKISENSKCKEFYKSIVSESRGTIRKCPFGLSVYYLGDYEAYSCLRIHGYYDQQATSIIKMDQSIDQYSTPILNPQSVEKFAHNRFVLEKLKGSNRELNESVGKTIHEIGNLSLHLYSLSYNLTQKLEKNKRNKDFVALARSIGFYSHMLEKLRDELDITDLMSQGQTKTINPFNHFENLRRTFEALTKCKIKLEGYTEKAVRWYNQAKDGNQVPYIKCHTSFSTVAFILFDNAYKYAPSGSDIMAEFEVKDGLYITIKNMGPELTKEELEKIFEYKFRGKNARADSRGSGIGLYTAKSICQKHGFGLDLNVEKLTCNGKSSIFSITLYVPEKFFVA